MKDLLQVFEDKKLENEFQNREVHPEGIYPPYQPILDELKIIKTKLKSYVFQANILEDRLRKLQKNYYDDMTIVDNTPGSVPVSPPWKSPVPFTSNQYEWWRIIPGYMVLNNPVIMEVAIRKAGNEKQVKVLDNICRRIQNLDQMAQMLKHRRINLKKELNDDHQYFSPNED